MFRIKIKDDDRVILKAKAEKIELFDDIFNDLKKKFKGDKR